MIVWSASFCHIVPLDRTSCNYHAGIAFLAGVTPRLVIRVVIETLTGEAIGAASAEIVTAHDAAEWQFNCLGSVHRHRRIRATTSTFDASVESGPGCEPTVDKPSGCDFHALKNTLSIG